MDLQKFLLLLTKFSIVLMLLIQAGATSILCSPVINSVSFIINQDYNQMKKISVVYQMITNR